MSDMATMPIRELVPELKARARKLGDDGNLVDCLVINTLANRLASQADVIDLLHAEIYDCENNEDFHGHTMVEKP